MIYFIACSGSGFIKIGFTENGRDAEARLAQLQTGNPHQLVVLATFHGGREQETSLHRRFKHKQKLNEWFELSSGELLEAFMILVGGDKWSKALDDLHFKIASSVEYGSVSKLTKSVFLPWLASEIGSICA